MSLVYVSDGRLAQNRDQRQRAVLLTVEQLRSGVPTPRGNTDALLPLTEYVAWRLQRSNHNLLPELPEHVTVVGFDHDQALQDFYAWAGSGSVAEDLRLQWEALRRANANQGEDRPKEVPEARPLLNLLLARFLILQVGYKEVQVTSAHAPTYLAAQLLRSVRVAGVPALPAQVKLQPEFRDVTALRTRPVAAPAIGQHSNMENLAVWDTCAAVDRDPAGRLERLLLPTTRFELAKHAIWKRDGRRWYEKLKVVTTVAARQPGGFQVQNQTAATVKYLLASGWHHNHHVDGNGRLLNPGALDQLIVAGCVGHTLGVKQPEPLRLVQSKDQTLVSSLSRYGVQCCLTS